MSHLLQMRGLKLLWQEKMILKNGVASFTDAWIETFKDVVVTRQEESHLLQMRGLKLIYLGINGNPHKVASFTDAWIETISIICRQDRLSVASFTDAWIETYLWNLILYFSYVASFTDAWIETVRTIFLVSPSKGRIFYRCVD